LLNWQKISEQERAGAGVVVDRGDVMQREVHVGKEVARAAVDAKLVLNAPNAEVPDDALAVAFTDVNPAMAYLHVSVASLLKYYSDSRLLKV
jgi:hypothetical protein